MTKTPDDIVSYIISRAMGPYFVSTDKQAFAAEIRAYGDQRVAEMRCQVEQLVARVVALEKAAAPDLTIPPKPTTRVATAIYEKRTESYPVSRSLPWDMLPPDAKAREIEGAQAAIEALREPDGLTLVINGFPYENAGTIITAYLDSILAEKQP